MQDVMVEGLSPWMLLYDLHRICWLQHDERTSDMLCVSAAFAEDASSNTMYAFKLPSNIISYRNQATQTK
jgi:hypothetical protein